MAGLIVGRNYRLKPPIVAPRPATSQNGRRSAKFIAWKPQIIVVALGTNDFSTQLNPGERWKTRGELHSDYEKTSARFIQSLRAGNPDAYIILWATDMADGEVQKVVQQAKAQGEMKISCVPVDHLLFSGCHWHSSLADDQTIRDKLVEFIDPNPTIWQGK